MKYRPYLWVGAVLLATAAVTSAVAQQPTPPPNRECQIPIYTGTLDQKPKILAKPDPKFNMEERRIYEREMITLSAVLCGSGKVTDIKVRKGSEQLHEKAIEAARGIQFIPAEKDGNKVSRVVILKYQVR